MGRRRTITADGMTTREKVLDEATTLFIEQGFTKAPLSEIASRLGITKAALYYYFQSKDELLLALVSPFLDRVDELLESVAGVTDDSAGRRELLSRYVEVLRSDSRAVDIIGRDVNVSTHPAVAPRINSHVGTLIEVLAGKGADQVAMARASAALTILQRGVFVHPGEPPALRSMEQDVRLTLLLDLAADIIEAGPDSATARG